MILAFLQRNRPAPLLFDIHVTSTLSLYKRDLQASARDKRTPGCVILYCEVAFVYTNGASCAGVFVLGTHEQHYKMVVT